MRLSDVKGERTLDVIAEIIEPIANIAEDEVATEIFARKRLPDGMTAKAFMLRRIKKSVPILIRKHKDDLITILCTIEGTSSTKYKESLNLPKLTKDVLDLLTDEEFMGLFTSAQTDSEDSSGSAPESIAEH